MWPGFFTHTRRPASLWTSSSSGTSIRERSGQAPVERLQRVAQSVRLIDHKGKPSSTNPSPALARLRSDP